MTDKLWTIRDVADFARVRDTKTVNAMIERGDLPPANIGVGVSRRWIAEHVRNFVAESGGMKRNETESLKNRRVS